MGDWNSAQYLKFESERTQPAKDLAVRMGLQSPEKIADIGCGPGNSTRVLQDFYPSARIIGYDSSENMLKRARKDCPGLEFELCDVSKDLPKLGGGFDAVFSNACLQWVPEHGKVIPELLAMLRPGGVLAVQVPMNYSEPIHRIIGTMSSSAKWRGWFPNPRIFYTLTPEGYYDILSKEASSFELWQTTYYHILPSQHAILEWYRATGMKPYLDALPEEKKPEFEADVMAQVETAYPPYADGKVIFRFPRFFLTAVK